MSDELLEKVLKTSQVKGVIHLGADAPCMQLFLYQKYKVPNILLVEGNPEHAKFYKEGKQNLDNALFVSEVISDKDDEDVSFRLIYSDDMTNKGCSSILEYSGQNIFPFISERDIFKTKTCSVDGLFKKYSLNKENYNFLAMDIQGAELLALKGFSNFPSSLAFIHTEVCFTELYKGQPLYGDIKEFLKQNGFVEFEMMKLHPTFGDALFIKEDYE